MSSHPPNRDTQGHATPPLAPSRGLVDWGAVALATGLGLGWSPVMPGTVGAVWGIPLAWAIQQLDSFWGEAALIALLLVAGIPLCTRAARALGGAKDPGSIVFDEIATVPIVLFAAPWDRPWWIVAGFVLHRLFDISKPPPVRQLEHLPAGLGIMADDVAAALYGSAVLHVALWLSPLA